MNSSTFFLIAPLNPQSEMQNPVIDNLTSH